MKTKIVSAMFVVSLLSACGGGSSSGGGTANTEPAADASTFDDLDRIIVEAIRSNPAVLDLSFQPTRSEIDCVRALSPDVTFDVFQTAISDCIANNG